MKKSYIKYVVAISALAGALGSSYLANGQRAEQTPDHSKLEYSLYDIFGKEEKTGEYQSLEN